jgi:hypothetical protein
MNLDNNHNFINYGEPFSSRLRQRRRVAALSYNDRSAEVTAMNAHLRASAYPEGFDPKSAGSPSTPMGSFTKLMRDYDNQARDNFAKEVVLFAIIVMSPFIWPVLRALAS